MSNFVLNRKILAKQFTVSVYNKINEILLSSYLFKLTDLYIYLSFSLLVRKLCIRGVFAGLIFRFEDKHLGDLRCSTIFVILVIRTRKMYSYAAGFIFIFFLLLLLLLLSNFIFLFSYYFFLISKKISSIYFHRQSICFYVSRANTSTKFN